MSDVPDRETLARVLHKSHCGCNDFGDESEDSSYWRMADAVLATLPTQPEESVILTAKADAWDEGFDAGERDAMGHETFDEPCIPNPYRAPIEQTPKDLFYTTLRGMNPSRELSAAIDRAEARESAGN